MKTNMTPIRGWAPKGQRLIGKVLFLPPYSPDLNPIELVFAKLKLLLCKAGERTIDAAWQRIGTLLDHFTPQGVRQLPQE